MPELPDLQVFSRNLTTLFKGKKLEKIAVKVAQKLNVPENKLQETLEGQTLTKVIRIGKDLQFEFDNSHVLATHLMLHGQLQLFDKTNDHKFTIVELLFEGDQGLALTDFQKAAHQPSTLKNWIRLMLWILMRNTCRIN
ncbi:MAG: DNA-formamidopyrimidine glycosylase [Mucilaginibacter sp.]|nr:DNA-formamidopyrimidine glycosylase [Mucilaginibacter sp.]